MIIEQINAHFQGMTPCQHEQEQAKLNMVYEHLDTIMSQGHGCKGQWIPGG